MYIQSNIRSIHTIALYRNAPAYLAAPTLARYSDLGVFLFLIGHNGRINLGILFLAP